MSDVVIHLSGVTKVYGTGAQASKALDNLDLEIVAGQFVSLMGPSGSGKTTLLNLIAGLDVPTSGRVFLNGSDLGTLADHQLADLRLRTIGFVFQAFNLIPALTVAENVAWPLEFSGYRRAEVRERTAQALRRTDVAGCERRYPGELSGGEQQRVAIARAVATAPSLLLADEPTGNLDSRTGQSILDLLRSLNQEQGVTVVMVTHNVFAATYGDRTLELHDGRIVRDVRTPARKSNLDPALANPKAS
jgi:putative ABC transport system ATP-binding protein